MQVAYSLLYGLFRYQWDADCELFLKVLQGEVKEDVYLAQLYLQQDLEELFSSLDRAKGQASGLISKRDLRVALASFFKAGQPDGKHATRFDEIMQAMENEHEGEAVAWKKLFEEDREFNQGESCL
jgi:hypothetical protein